MPVTYLQKSTDAKIFPTSGTGLNITHSTETCGLPHCIAAVDNPAKNGSNTGPKAIRMELKKDDPKVGSSGKKRDEVVIIKPVPTAEMWYGWSVMFPSVGWEFDSTRDCMNQFYEDGSTETTIRCASDHAFLETFASDTGTAVKPYDLFGKAIPKDEWHDFIFHIIHSKGADGLIEIWRDGVKIHNIVGRNMHLQLPKWKLGEYKASFLDGSSKLSTRVIFWDNIRMGPKGTTLAEMSLGVTPPDSNKPPVVNLGQDVVITLPVNSVTFNVIATDPDNDIVATTISKVSGGPATINGATVSGLIEGPYVFKVVGTDGKGGTAEDSANVTVKPAVVTTNVPPVANAGADQSTNLTASVVLKGTASDSDGTIVSTTWKRSAGGNCIINTPSQLQTVVSALEPGDYEFELSVTDNKGAVTTSKTKVTVVNQFSTPVNEMPASYTIAGKLTVTPKFPDGSTGEPDTLDVYSV